VDKTVPLGPDPIGIIFRKAALFWPLFLYIRGMKSVSIIIPTFNGCGLLKEYLPHTYDVISHSREVSDYEIIVIDDASTDDTAAYIRDTGIPNLIYLSNDSNSGFSKTINKGIGQARMELCLLLNNDMDIPQDFFEKTVPFMADDSVFGVCTEIRDRAAEKVIEGRKLPCMVHRELYFKETTEVGDGLTLYLCGGNALVDTRKLQELNGFNELFSPFFYEDYDLSLRALRKGWKSLYTDRTFCRHTPSSTIRKENETNFIGVVTRRNRILLTYLHNGTWDNLILLVKVYVKYLFAKVSKKPGKRHFIDVAHEFYRVRKDAAACKKEEYKKLGKLDLTVFR